ncbi:MAG: DUF1513 domain-containing protein [Myxococcota bacterium]
MRRHAPHPAWRRREFLAGVGALPLLVVGCEQEGPATPIERWLAATGDDESSYGIVLASADGEATVIHTGFRGHDLVHRPGSSRVIMFGRRPGTFAIEVDVERGEIVRTLEAAEDRALQGHGCFTPDGRLLITCEADIESGQGRLVVRDADGLAILRELDSHGIGPHQIALMPDGHTLVVANGGILTRPETGADKLNLDTMRSSLAYVDLETGYLIDEQLVAEPKASIRHLDVCPDGAVVVAMQIQREAMDHDEVVPLAGVHHPGSTLRPFDSGLDFVGAMEDYAGSVVANPRTRVLAVTSPRGDLALFWNLDSGELMGHLPFHDVCGVAVSSDSGSFVLTGAGGQVRRVDATNLQILSDIPGPFGAVRWDNHLIIT